MFTTETLLTELKAHPHLSLGMLADQHETTEAALIKLLPAEWARLWEQPDLESLFHDLESWGMLTTIVEAAGSIFEFKGRWPAGRSGRGYYNLQGDDQAGNGLQGHLALQSITAVALLSRPFMGRNSYSFVFLTETGRSAFKIYLGRDLHHDVLSGQLTRFQQWQQCVSLEQALQITKE